MPFKHLIGVVNKIFMRSLADVGVLFVFMV